MDASLYRICWCGAAAAQLLVVVPELSDFYASPQWCHCRSSPHASAIMEQQQQTTPGHSNLWHIPGIPAVLERPSDPDKCHLLDDVCVSALCIWIWNCLAMRKMRKQKMGFMNYCGLISLKTVNRKQQKQMWKEIREKMKHHCVTGNFTPGRPNSQLPH